MSAIRVDSIFPVYKCRLDVHATLCPRLEEDGEGQKSRSNLVTELGVFDADLIVCLDQAMYMSLSESFTCYLDYSNYNSKDCCKSHAAWYATPEASAVCAMYLVAKAVWLAAIV